MSKDNGNGRHGNGQVNGNDGCNDPTNGAARNGNGVHTGDDAIPVPGTEQALGQDLIWDSLPPSVTGKLAQPLDSSLVSRRKGRGGHSFSYVEGRTAIDQANRIFGYGGWGHEVVGEVALRELDQVDSKTGEVKRIRAYSATVRVNVPGAPSRTDVGFHSVAEETAEGHETAFKGAVTDGLKRALRTFGGQFGNALYGDFVPGTELAPALRKTLLDLGVTQGFDEERVRAAVKKQTGKDLDDLPASELTPLVERAARKVQEACPRTEHGASSVPRSGVEDAGAGEDGTGGADQEPAM